MTLNPYCRLTQSSKTWGSFVCVKNQLLSHGSLLLQFDCTTGKTTPATLFQVNKERIRKDSSRPVSHSFQSSLAYPLMKCFLPPTINLTTRRKDKCIYFQKYSVLNLYGTVIRAVTRLHLVECITLLIVIIAILFPQ